MSPRTARRSSSSLALLGGQPVLRAPLPAYASLGEAEVEAVARVARSGCLSGFYGSAGEQFLGGPVVREFEQAWRTRFGVRHAVSVNSATSGLVAAMGALGVGRGDEVIVPPTTMSATAIAPLAYGATPVFADVEEETFGLDPDAVRRAITPRTKAIVAVDLMGHPARLAELAQVAADHGLRLVEDNAQGPLAAEHGRYAGTVGDIGVFSLNYHKHIHTGEGGVCVTDDDELATRLQLVRNHGENVVEDLGLDHLDSLFGFNLRLTELQAAIGLVQLERADEHVGRRERLGRLLTEGASGLAGITPPVTRPGCRHVYYLWALRLDERELGVPRAAFSAALAAEGFPHFTGYVRPLYHLPVFRRLLARLPDCPVAERLYERELLCFETCFWSADDDDAEALVEALRKVHAHRHELSERAA